jgi:transposase
MKNDKKALESIGIALGLRGPSQKQCEKAAKRFTGRQRGKPIDLDVRKNIAKRLLMGRAGDTYRSIAIEFGVSLGSITNIKKRIVDVEPSDDNAPSMDTIVESLRNRKRCGGAATKRKIGNDDAHAAFVRELLEKHDARLQLSELCTLFERQFEVRVSTSTMHRFVHRQLGFSRQRVQRQLPRQALTEKNIKWRKEFIGEWFVGADEQLIGTNDEQNDQNNWQLRTDGKRDLALAEQVFWVDETGCNRHTLLRTHGLARRGNGGVRAAGRFDGQKGRNHSVLIAIGAAGGIVARKVRMRSEERGAMISARFFAHKVAPAMLASANAAGVDRRAPLYLMMDNASIHRGAVVSHAIQSANHTGNNATFSYVHSRDLPNASSVDVNEG